MTCTLLMQLGFEDYVYGDGVSLIEWANLIEDILPKEYTEVLIEKDLVRGTTISGKMYTDLRNIGNM